MEAGHMRMEEVVAWAREAVNLYQRMQVSTKQHGNIPRLGNLLRSHSHRALSRPLCQIAHCRNRGLVCLGCGRLSLDRPSLRPFFCPAHTYRSYCRPFVNDLFLGLSVDLFPDPLSVRVVPAVVEAAGSLAVLSSYVDAVSVSQARES
jgi:hypothetical protein